MGIKASQLRSEVILPVMYDLATFSKIPRTKFAEDLLIATAAQETHCGEYIKQLNGPAVGIYQIEPASFGDLYTKYLGPNYERFSTVIAHCGGLGVPALDLITFNLRYATLIARLFYYRVPIALPPKTTMETLWSYYKPHWNTAEGTATFQEFAYNIRAYSDITFEEN